MSAQQHLSALVVGTSLGFVGSPRRLIQSYRGPTLQVHDGTTLKDIWRVKDLPAAGGANNLFVQTLYDQSGNGFDFAAANSGARPKIYDGATGKVLVNSNGSAVMRFDGVNDDLTRANPGNIFSGTGWTLQHLCKVAVGVGGYAAFSTWGNIEFVSASPDYLAIQQGAAYGQWTSAPDFAKQFFWNVHEINYTLGAQVLNGTDGVLWTITGAPFGVSAGGLNNAFTTVTTGPHIGANLSSPDFMPMDLAAILMWPSRLTKLANTTAEQRRNVDLLAYFKRVIGI